MIGQIQERLEAEIAVMAVSALIPAACASRLPLYPAAQRTTMQLTLEGISQRDVARRMGITESRVSQIAKAATERLRERLQCPASTGAESRSSRRPMQPNESLRNPS